MCTLAQNKGAVIYSLGSLSLQYWPVKIDIAKVRNMKLINLTNFIML